MCFSFDVPQRGFGRRRVRSRLRALLNTRTKTSTTGFTSHFSWGTAELRAQGLVSRPHRTYRHLPRGSGAKRLTVVRTESPSLNLPRYSIVLTGPAIHPSIGACCVAVRDPFHGEARRGKRYTQPGRSTPVSLAVHFRSHPSHTIFGSAFPLELTHMPSLWV